MDDFFVEMLFRDDDATLPRELRASYSFGASAEPSLWPLPAASLDECTQLLDSEALDWALEGSDVAALENCVGSVVTADMLKREVAHLSSHLALLRSEQQQLQRSKAAAHWAEVAKGERCHRRASERQNAALRHSLFVQRSFLANFKSLLASDASFALSTELNLHALLHSYCRLGASKRLREHAAEAMFSDEKLDLAIQMVLSETASMQRSVLAPSIASARVTSSTTAIGATQKCVFVFDTDDRPCGTMFAAVDVCESARHWPRHTLMDADSVSDSPAKNMHFDASTVRFRSVDTGNPLAVESRSVLCVRATEEYCLMVADCVDADELYPMTPTSSCVRQDVVAVFLLRRESCEDGVERMVCRGACTKLHTSGALEGGAKENLKQFVRHSEAGVQMCAAWMYRRMKQNTARPASATN